MVAVSAVAAVPFFAVAALLLVVPVVALAVVAAGLLRLGGWSAGAGSGLGPYWCTLRLDRRPRGRVLIAGLRCGFMEIGVSPLAQPLEDVGVVLYIYIYIYI